MTMRLILAALTAFSLTLGSTAVFAADKTATTASQPERPPANIDGFRSAHFGDDEDSVRSAIKSDFGLKGDAVHRTVHPTEKTVVLTVSVDKMVPEAGTALVSYIFGYQTQKLIQVNVTWSQLPGMNLGTAATILRNHFLEQAFRDDSVVVNAKLPDGSLLAFRGVDAHGRMVVLAYQPVQPPANRPASDKPDIEGILNLSYIQSPGQPDVFVLKPGQF